MLLLLLLPVLFASAADVTDVIVEVAASGAGVTDVVVDGIGSVVIGVAVVQQILHMHVHIHIFTSHLHIQRRLPTY